MWKVDYIESLETKWEKGSDPMHYYLAQLTHLVASVAGNKKSKVDHYMIDFKNTSQLRGSQKRNVAALESFLGI